MIIADGSKHFGDFKVGYATIQGELSLNGASTNLYLHNPVSFRPDANEDQSIHGVLHDKTRVSLMKCVAPPITGSAIVGSERYAFADIFPHFVVHGRRHLGPAEKSVEAIRFVTDDAATIFYDFDAFSSVLRPRRFIRGLTKSNGKIVDREIAVGRQPQIAYFTGKGEIFKAMTIIGDVSASHNPRANFGGPNGVFIGNFITVNIAFPGRSTFANAIDGVVTMLLFLELIAGRRQNLKNVFLDVGRKPKDRATLEVYWSMPATREGTPDDRKPQPADLPIMAAQHPESFAQILESWLARHDEWREPRTRMWNSSSKGRAYDTDRLIGAANTFDILPTSALLPEPKLSAELIAARDKARDLFKELPEGAERDGVLSALGRMKGSSLRQKIAYRAQPIIERLPSLFHNLVRVTDLAVDCRNHFVHGSEPKADYTKNFFKTVPFLTDALEFVFAATDLMDAGWDIVEWRTHGTTMSHPFGRFCVDYGASVEQLNSVLRVKDRIPVSR
jgi:hypothetical protein